MRILILFCFFLYIGFGCAPKTADKVVAPLTPSVEDMTSISETTPFPESWVGEWTGELDIWKGTGKIQTLSMNMSITPAEQLGEYHWKTTFGDNAETTKPYLLRAKDKANGVYVIDELNSIVLESYLFDNKLASWYVVEGNLILATFEKRDEQIVFEILAGSEEAVSITGGQKVAEEDIPEVKTMPFSVMQRAVLVRK